MKDIDLLLKFTEPTDRVKRLKAEILTAKPELDINRARIVTKCHKGLSIMPKPMIRAMCLDAVLREIPIFIGDDELIVGNFARKLRAAPFFPEYAAEWLAEELDDLSERESDPFLVYKDEKEEFEEIIDYWKNISYEKMVTQYGNDELLEARASGVLMGDHLLTSGHGHIIANYPKVLEIGLNGFLKEAEEVISKLDLKLSEDVHKHTFLNAVVIVLNAAIKFAERYAVLAEEKAKSEKNVQRKAELQRIAVACKNVPANPARNFHEALQAIWIIQIVIQLESNGHSISLGRLDQYTYSLFCNDIINGAISYGDAQELLGCLFIKMHSVNKIRTEAHSIYGSGYPTYQNLTIGGQAEPGVDGVNEVTYLTINAMENVRFPSPNLTARIWAGSPDVYLKKCADSIALGHGMPALLDDDVIISSLLLRGVKLKDAYNYSAMGCVEIGIAGRWGYRETGMTFFNFLKVLEITINGGKDPIRKYSWGNTKTIEEMDSFEELKKAWKYYIKKFVNLEAINNTIVDVCLNEYPDIFCSALIDNCIERGKPILEGGAVYDMVSGVQMGLANTANGFAAIRKLIFEDGMVGKKELMSALGSNFTCEKGEVLRQLLINKSPKYGNDDDYVDELAKWLYEVYMDEIEDIKNTRFGKGPIGGGYFASTVGISSNIGAGKRVGATPDGRKAFTPTAEGGSPQAGTDIVGPTAVLKSVSKMPTIRMTGGQLLNLKFSPSVVENDEDRWKLVGLMRTLCDLKLWHMQLNIVSKEMLLEAQKRPDEYRSLMVRVAGYCALFNDLNVETQNDIISRTEYNRI